MEKYLLKLIKENNRIIIPNFGAFIVSNEKGRNVLFNNFLSFNDGLLISHICSEEGIDSAAAAGKVEVYVAKINDALNKDGFFEIAGIGNFTKDESGFIRFEQAGSSVLEGSSEEEKVAELESIEDDNDLLDLDVPSEAVEEKVTLVEEPVVEEKVIIPPAVSTSENEKKVIVERMAEKKNGWSPAAIAAVIIVLLLLAFGAYLLFFTDVVDNMKESYNARKSKTEQPVITDTAIDSLDVTEVNVTETIDEQVIEPVVPSVRQHYIIVGSYKSEQLALSKVKELVEQGYKDASVLPYNDRFLASVESHSSVREALRRQEELLSELRAENWVLSLSLK